MDSSAIQLLARQVRYDILRITHRAGSGHPTSSFSAVDLATALFFKHVRFDLEQPENPNNDRFILSKGHGSALLYSLYAAAGKISEEELLTYRDFKSPLEGHPTFRFPLTEAAGGSLGQGLSIGPGMAWALGKRQVSGVMRHEEEANKNMTHDTLTHDILTHDTLTLDTTPHVFVLLGDGELAEGSNWEAAAWASHHKLHNLVAIVDVNRLGQAEATMYEHNTDIYRSRFEAFGFSTIVIDGHDFNQIDVAMGKARRHTGGPSVIIAKTIKGKGVPFWEDKTGWHNKMLPKIEFEKALALFKPEKRCIGSIQKPENVSSVMYHASGNDTTMTPDTLTHDTYAKNDLVPTKKAFGNAIERLGSQYPDLVVLDGDMANSTHTDQFAKAYPDRFLQMYIAEQNMAGVAIGLARRGLKPFISTFACFLTRAHDQLRMMPLSDVSVCVNGTYVGVSMGKDGPSQMGLDDLALFRGMYGSTVLYPSDPYQTERLVEAMLKTKGVSYIRTTREPTPVLYGLDDEFPIGGSKIHYSSSEEPASPAGRSSTNREASIDSSRLGSNNNLVTIVSAGITLHEALKAQKELEKEHICVRVIDCYSVKPIDAGALQKAAKDSKAIIVVEDHYPEGGLGDAVRTALSDTAIPIYHLAVTKLPMSGTCAELLAYEGIDCAGIIVKVKEMLSFS